MEILDSTVDRRAFTRADGTNIGFGGALGKNTILTQKDIGTDVADLELFMEGTHSPFVGVNDNDNDSIFLFEIDPTNDCVNISDHNLAKNHNNHFGIKCKSDWTGAKAYQDDDAKQECFRAYDAAEQSFKDHSNFLKNRPNYVALFLLDPVDDTAWAYGLKKAGYATASDYPKKLLKIIDDYELAQYNFPELANEIEEEEASKNDDNNDMEGNDSDSELEKPFDDTSKRHETKEPIKERQTKTRDVKSIEPSSGFENCKKKSSTKIIKY
jgi:hypothetical protein